MGSFTAVCFVKVNVLESKVKVAVNFKNNGDWTSYGKAQGKSEQDARKIKAIYEYDEEEA